MTIDEMIAAIEKKVCIRKIWRANAGWGMFTIPLYVVDSYRNEMETWFERRRKFGAAHPQLWGERPIEPESILDGYYPTLEECVRAEHARFCS